MQYSHYLVSDLLADPGAVSDVEVAIPLELSFEDATIAATAEGPLRLEAASRGIVARGAVTVTARLRCVRCLTEFDAPITADVAQVYGFGDDDDALPIAGDGRIDLEAPVREEVAMAVPMAPVCRESCKGLCDTCGTDLNTDPCGGHARVSTSPFAALEGLFSPE